MLNGDRRTSWRLRVYIPDLASVDHQALFRWLREYVIPACLNAPVSVTLEFVPGPDELPPDQPSS